MHISLNEEVLKLIAKQQEKNTLVSCTSIHGVVLYLEEILPKRFVVWVIHYQVDSSDTICILIHDICMVPWELMHILVHANPFTFAWTLMRHDERLTFKQRCCISFPQNHKRLTVPNKNILSNCIKNSLSEWLICSKGVA